MKRTVAAGASALLLLVTLACGQQTWDAAMQAGETALQRGQYEQAEKIFSAAVHKAEEFGLHDRRVAVTLAHLAQAYSAQGKFVEAEPVYLEALKIYQDVHGENHLDVAAMLNNLGVLHRKHGQYADAQRLLTRALSIKEKLLGTDHPEVALALSNLAAMYLAQGDGEQAGPYLRGPWRCGRSIWGPTIRMWPKILRTMRVRCASWGGSERQKGSSGGRARFGQNRNRDGGGTELNRWDAPV
ncbi:MAG: tetratricopeptide repeat protein [Nitrospira sp.]|nr:tetratricopeptide repeat protein [Nitrospira sp.]